MLILLNKYSGACSIIVMIVGLIGQGIYNEAINRAEQRDLRSRVAALESASLNDSAGRTTVAVKLSNLDARLANVETGVSEVRRILLDRSAFRNTSMLTETLMKGTTRARE